jgi:hypothetical protein
LVADSQGFNVGHPEAVAKSGRFITMELEHANRHALQYCVDLIYARIDKYGNDVSEGGHLSRNGCGRCNLDIPRRGRVKNQSEAIRTHGHDLVCILGSGNPANF